MKTVGFIDYFLNEWHADNLPEWLDTVSKGRYRLAYAWGEIDCPRDGGVSNASWAAKHGAVLCSTQEEVIDKSDVLCVLAPDNVETHERLSRLALESGKPVYVDKTFAPDLSAAKRIFSWADGHKTPCMTTSALRYAEEYEGLRAGDISGAVFSGGGRTDIYLIHLIEPMVMLLGPDAQRVMMAGTADQPVFIVEYPDVRATLSMFHAGYPFETGVNFKDGTARHLSIRSDIFHRFAQELVRFFDTGRVTVPREQTLAAMAVREACLRAMDADGWVDVPKVG